MADLSNIKIMPDRSSSNFNQSLDSVCPVFMEVYTDVVGSKGMVHKYDIFFGVWLHYLMDLLSVKAESTLT